jgi:hypothetical protein
VKRIALIAAAGLAMAAAADPVAMWFHFGDSPSAPASWTPPDGTILWTTFDNPYPASPVFNATFTNRVIWPNRVLALTTQMIDRAFVAGNDSTATNRLMVLPSGNVVWTNAVVNSRGAGVPLNTLSKVDGTGGLGPTGAYTYAAWAWRATNANETTILMRENIKPLIDIFSGNLRVVTVGGAGTVAKNFAAPATGVWVHVALTRTAAGVETFWTNGVFAGAWTNTGSSAATDILAFGSQSAGNFGWIGRLDDLIVATNVVDVQYLYQQGAPDTRGN